MCRLTDFFAWLDLRGNGPLACDCPEQLPCERRDIAYIERWVESSHEYPGWALFRLADGRWGVYTEWSCYTGHGCWCGASGSLHSTRESAIWFGLDDYGRELLGLGGD